MAGTSGCIPDYHVNFFGQLCKSARRGSSAMPSPKPESEPHIGIETQTTTASESRCLPKDGPAPRDPIADLFQENQDLIRGLSCGNIETYQATLRAVFKEVRESRRDSRAERAQRREVGDEGADTEMDVECQAGCEDGNRVTTNGNQSQTPQQAGDGIEHHKQQEQDQQHPPDSQDLEYPTIQKDNPDQNQPQPQSQLRLQSALNVPRHHFVITHYPQHGDQIGLILQSRGP